MTMVVPLLLTSGPVRYEGVFQNNVFVFLCLCVKGLCRGQSGFNQPVMCRGGCSGG